MNIVESLGTDILTPFVFNNIVERPYFSYSPFFLLTLRQEFI